MIGTISTLSILPREDETELNVDVFDEAEVGVDIVGPADVGSTLCGVTECEANEVRK